MAERRFKLVLDESGQFWGSTVRDNSYYSSIVAGVLLSGRAVNQFDKTAARKMFVDIKTSNSLFNNIRISPYYHGMKEKDPYNGEFVYTFMKKLSESDGMEIVSFRNPLRNYIIDEDNTYLFVLVYGIIKLIKDKLSDTKDNIFLDIFYAGRQIQVTGNGISKNDNGQIAMPEYIERLKYLLQVEFFKLPEDIRNRVRYNFSSGFANDNDLLMVADLVCTGLRGGYMPDDEGIIHFNDAIKEKIYSLSMKEYKLDELGKWDNIRDKIIQSDIVGAVLDWYKDRDTESDGLLADYRIDFTDKLLCRFNEINYNLLNLYALISENIKQLVDDKDYDKAIYLVNRLEKEFCQFLENNKRDNRRLLFDLYFYKITIYSHLGMQLQCVEAIAEADKLLKSKIFSSADRNYRLRYKNRIIEPCINMYNADEAILSIEDLIKQREDQNELLAEPDEEELGKDIELGKLYGTYIRIVSYFYANDQKLVAQAKAYIEKAILSFSDSSTDLSKAYQNACMLHIACGEFENALEYLAKAVGCKPDANDIAASIAFQGPFLIFHYTNLMERFTSKGNDLYKAFCDNKILTMVDGLQNMHPRYAIYLKIARFLRATNQTEAIRLYKKVEEIALKDIEQFPIYSAGLCAKAERVMLERGVAKNKGIDETYDMMIAFLDKWKEYDVWYKQNLEVVDCFNTEDKSMILMNFVDVTPII